MARYWQDGEGLGYRRRWYLIDEVELMGLISDDSEIERLCDEIISAAAHTGALRHGLAVLLANLAAHTERQKPWFAALLFPADRHGVVPALLQPALDLHQDCIRSCQELMLMIENGQDVPVDMVRTLAARGRELVRVKEDVVRIACAARLTPDARVLLDARRFRDAAPPGHGDAAGAIAPNGALA